MNINLIFCHVLNEEEDKALTNIFVLSVPAKPLILLSVQHPKMKGVNRKT